MMFLGLDIGGANIKAATPNGKICSHRYALWKHPEKLAKFLTEKILPRFPGPRHIALTMTGELCDCFQDKSEGVEQILAAVQQACGTDPVSVYMVDGCFVPPKEACAQPLKAAASNWHALANFARRWIPDHLRSGVLIDMGSTSCDLIPITKDRVLALGKTDATRIANHELVYTGIARTPVCAVTNRVAFRGNEVPIAQEVFATMQDVYLVLEQIPEQESNQETADGRPLTRFNSIRRLSRMLCADPAELKNGEVFALATEIAAAQRWLVLHSLKQILPREEQKKTIFILSGSGTFVAREIVGSVPEATVICLEDQIGKMASEVAPAYAVASLLENLWQHQETT